MAKRGVADEHSSRGPSAQKRRRLSGDRLGNGQQEAQDDAREGIILADELQLSQDGTSNDRNLASSTLSSQTSSAFSTHRHSNPDPDPEADADINADAGTPATTVSTPRPRFPSDLKTLACTWPGCSKTFNRPARLRDHLNSHTNSRPFKCPYPACDKDYIEDKHLKQHVKAVHTHERPYVCSRDGCGRAFVTATRLSRHQAVHDGADRFRCPDCRQSFRKKDTLHKHLRTAHLGLPAHACPHPGCSQAFATKPSLRRHIDREHGEPRFWCDECASPVDTDAVADGTTSIPRAARVGFTTEALLREHIRNEHQNCLFCDYKAPSRWQLEQHIETNHSGKTVEERKTHACDFKGCPKTFTSSSNLQVHVRSAHLGVRFVCGEVALSGPDFDNWCPDATDAGCRQSFVTKARLEDHVRYVHLGLPRPRFSRPRPVDIATRLGATDFIDVLSGAAAADAAARHAISCPHCDDLFLRYHDLDRHVARAHQLSRFDERKDANDGNCGNNGNDHDGVQDVNAIDGDDPLFADQMDAHDPLSDDWLDDEANLLLLAHHLSPPPPPVDSLYIDPVLAAG